MAVLNRNTAHRSLSSTHYQPDCVTSAPTRMIVLSRGRGGSSVLAKTLAVFAKSNPKWLHHELFGSNQKEMKRCEEPKSTMKNWFFKMEKEQPNARVVGFKWKPYVYSDLYDDAWDWVRRYNVSVVWMTRNLLDVCISNAKHDNADLSAHCKPGDAKCVADHTEAKVTLNASALVSRLEFSDNKYDSQLRETLVANNVSYRQLNFEDLFVGEDGSLESFYLRKKESPPPRDGKKFFLRPISESSAALAAWNTIFSFVGVREAEDYSEIQKVASSESESTAPRTNCDSIENLEEVQTALKGTRFSRLLGC